MLATIQAPILADQGEMKTMHPKQWTREKAATVGVVAEADH